MSQRNWEVIVQSTGGTEKINVSFPERWTRDDVSRSVSNSYGGRVVCASPTGRN